MITFLKHHFHAHLTFIAQLTGPPKKSALQVAAASGHVSIMEVVSITLFIIVFIMSPSDLC